MNSRSGCRPRRSHGVNRSNSSGRDAPGGTRFERLTVGSSMSGDGRVRRHRRSPERPGIIDRILPGRKRRRIVAGTIVAARSTRPLPPASAGSMNVSRSFRLRCNRATCTRRSST